MRQDVVGHINAFLEKLENRQYEDLEIHLMHFHGVITEQEYTVLSQRLVYKVIYSRIAKREGMSVSQVRRITHGAIWKLIELTEGDNNHKYHEVRFKI